MEPQKVLGRALTYPDLPERQILSLSYHPKEGPSNSVDLHESPGKDRGPSKRSSEGLYPGGRLKVGGNRGRKEVGVEKG